MGPARADDASLRVLFVCGADFRAPSEKQVLGFAEQLTARGNGVMASVVGLPETVESEAARAIPGLEVHRRRLLGRRLDREALAEARRFGPTLIHAWNARLPVVTAARRYSEATGAPVFFHFEDDEWGLAGPRPGEAVHRRLGRRVRRRAGAAHALVWPYATESTLAWVAEHARGLDALTPALAQHVQKRLGRECGVVLPVAPSAARGPTTSSDGPAGGSRNGDPVVLYTGSVYGVHEADMRLGLEAVAAVQSAGRRVRLVHAGAMAPRLDGDRLAGEAGLAPGSASFLGYLPFQQMPELLASASVLIQPGRPTEFNRLRLPSKLQAYLASGTPTVTFATGFGELLADRREVLKTYGGEASELAERLIELLDDGDLRRTLAVGGPAAAARLFDPVSNTDALLAHYRRPA